MALVTHVLNSWAGYRSLSLRTLTKKQRCFFSTYGVHGSSRLPEGPREKKNFVDRYVEGLKRTRPSYFLWVSNGKPVVHALSTEPFGIVQRARHMTRYQKYRALLQVSIWHVSLLFPILLVNLIPGLWSLDELYYFDYFGHQVA